MTPAEAADLCASHKLSVVWQGDCWEVYQNPAVIIARSSIRATAIDLAADEIAMGADSYWRFHRNTGGSYEVPA